MKKHRFSDSCILGNFYVRLIASICIQTVLESRWTEEGEGNWISLSLTFSMFQNIFLFIWPRENVIIFSVTFCLIRSGSKLFVHLFRSCYVSTSPNEIHTNPSLHNCSSRSSPNFFPILSPHPHTDKNKCQVFGLLSDIFAPHFMYIS
jgi:hypothetical protein